MTDREIYNQAFKELYNHCLLEEKLSELGMHLDEGQGVYGETINSNYDFCFNLIYQTLKIKIFEVKEKIPYNLTYVFAYTDDEDYDFILPLDRLDDIILKIRGSELGQEALWNLYVNKDKSSIPEFEKLYQVKFGVTK